MRFIGSCRPPRMLARWGLEQLNGRKIIQSEKVDVESITKVGIDEITLSGTSTETYLAEGFMAHNTTPFEAVTFTFEVMAPIFVFRQWHRHRTWSFNELSARYKELPELYYVPAPQHIGKQFKDNKQMRDMLPSLSSIYASGLIDETCKKAFHAYKDLLEEDVPREVARGVLPLNTYSHMFATVNLLNLLKFLTLRSDIHAQYEIRVYADAMKELIMPIVPVCLMAWETNP